MTVHTPEPWRMDHEVIRAAGGEPICVLTHPTGADGGDRMEWPLMPGEPRADSDEAEANGARIVACVNALDGLEPSGVADLIEAAGELDDQIRGIGFEDWHGAEGFDCGPFRAALAKLEAS